LPSFHIILIILGACVDAMLLHQYSIIMLGLVTTQLFKHTGLGHLAYWHYDSILRTITI